MPNPNARRQVRDNDKPGKDRQSGFTELGQLVCDYLTERHCADRANGCAIAALGADMARQGDGVRDRFQQTT